jgi:signal transduction histidine kinase
LLTAFAASWRAAKRALKPLRVMAATADEIEGAEDLSRRLPTYRTRDELQRLAGSFNGMLTRLDEAHRRLADALATEKRLVADASHELRTPLTSIRSNADFLLRRPEARASDREAALRDIAAESERMSRLVHDLLILARADAGHHLDRVSLDFLPIVREVARQTWHLHPGRQITVERLGGDGPVVVAGDAETLRRLVWILVDNAVKHTEDGGRIGLGLATHDGHVELRVADDGPGIPEADLERIFERFYRADAARTTGGVGLGLSIARWVVAEHGGQIRARNNAGGGATFVVELPLDD